MPGAPTPSARNVRPRELFRTRWGFVLAAVGSAVGLGNMWRFSYVAAENGGAAFVFLYVGMILLLGIPLMLCELTVGRRTRLSPIGALRALGGPGWVPLGLLFVVTGFLILSYYSVIAGWTLRYAAEAVTVGFPSEPGPHFDRIAAGGSAVGWHLAFMALTIGIVMIGVQKGIERAAIVLMPTLFLIVVGLAVWAVSLEGAADGYRFYLRPDPAELMDPGVISQAMSQAFFSLSLGMGAMLTFASYLARETDLNQESVTISLADFAVAFAAGLVVFPVIFALGLQDQVSESTVGALFIALPGAFEAMGGVGRVVGTLFFVALAVGALTSAISLLEVVTASVIDELGAVRRNAAIGIGALIGLAGLASALNTDLLGLVDQIAGDLFLVLGALFMSIFVGWFNRPESTAELAAGASPRSRTAIPMVAFLVRWVLPPVIAFVLWFAVQDARAEIGAFLGAAPAAAHAQSEALHPCATATEECEGTIRVPLDWDDLGAGELDVAFAWIPRADTTRPAEGTILANVGGPSATIPWVPLLRQILGPLLDRQNLLVVDPRGLGESDPLVCPDLDMTEPASVTACAEGLGSRIRYYHTAKVVRDMDAVREALGVPELSFYGNSYGTVFGQAYALRFPDRTSGLYLDSVVPLVQEGWAADAYGRSTEAVELVCSRSSSCAALPESPTATVERLTETLRAEPDPAVPIGAIRVLLQGVNVVASREVVAAGNAYLEGDAAPLHRLAAGLGGAERTTPPEHAGTLAIQCADSRFSFDPEASPEDRERQLDRFYDEAKPYAPLRREELLEGGLVSWAEDCLHWPVSAVDPPAPPEAPVSPVPVLVATSDFDTWSAEEVAEAMDRFPESTFLHVRFGGHAQALGPWDFSECVRRVLRDFLTDPRHPTPVPTPEDPDACDRENYRAVGSFPPTMADTPPADAVGLAVREQHLVAAALATVMDAVARRNPVDVVPRPSEEDGLRGGRTRWDAEDRTLTLEEVRFVADLVVSGTVRLGTDAVATAELMASPLEGGAHELTLRWQAFVAEDATRVRGSLDGRRFTALVPLH
jgi:SNF family Na+-dependent transporter/pimeloyl-ACP methyl ester carboxylesterase